jgi:hypothetical protein
MKEMDILTLTDNEDYIKRSLNGFQDNDEVEDDVVIIQLIVQGKPITASEDLLAKYSKYFWNLFQNLPPLPQKHGRIPGNGKIGNIVLNVLISIIVIFVY